MIRGGNDWKIRMLTLEGHPSTGRDAVSDGHSSSQWHPDPRPDRLEPGRFDSRRLNDILVIVSGRVLRMSQREFVQPPLGTPFPTL
jgi:hypothetical protein